MRFVIAPVVTMVCFTSSPALSSCGAPIRHSVAIMSYIQLSMSCSAKFAASR